MNYIGCKLSLIDFIDSSIEKVTNGDYTSLCDLFAGTGTVGKHFKRKGKKIIANDIQAYSYVLNRHYIGNHKPLLFHGLNGVIPALSDSVDKPACVCDYLNNLDGERGFIFNNYCPSGDGKRLYFTDENGMRCDSIRNTIESWFNSNKINDDEYYFLLCSLIESIDKVANTASVYGAYLKSFKKSALVSMNLLPAEILINDQDHVVMNDDANVAITKIQADVLYLDPPYNQRQYATNYHVLETIAKNDNPTIHGKTGLRNYEKQKSLYCSRSHVKETFQNLISNANVKYIFLSYNNEGLLSPNEISDIMSKRGKYGYLTVDYHRFRADNKREYSANKTKEYLHYVVCNPDGASD